MLHLLKHCKVVALLLSQSNQAFLFGSLQPEILTAKNCFRFQFFTVSVEILCSSLYCYIFNLSLWLTSLGNKNHPLLIYSCYFEIVLESSLLQNFRHWPVRHFVSFSLFVYFSLKRLINQNFIHHFHCLNNLLSVPQFLQTLFHF